MLPFSRFTPRGLVEESVKLARLIANEHTQCSCLRNLKPLNCLFCFFYFVSSIQYVIITLQDIFLFQSHYYITRYLSLSIFKDI